MKKMFVPLSVIAGLLISSAVLADSLHMNWPNGMVAVADFKNLPTATNGGVGNNFNLLPERYMRTLKIREISDNTKVTCDVDEKGKAVNEKGNLIGTCVPTDLIRVMFDKDRDRM